MATMHSGKTFLNELGEVGLRNCKVVPRTHDIWIGINRLRQILPRFTFRIPACERGLEAVSNYRTVRTTSTGLAVDEPVHDWSSHAASALKVIAEAEAAAYAEQRGFDSQHSSTPGHGKDRISRQRSRRRSERTSSTAFLGSRDRM